ncbi:hypothetical protein M758_1G132200 [Ceratodon purpureus]|uniref:Late embryogenesis abundant protein LEA-2 subgroup domain-containing protein n=1 Tax=Ceratodon purpureus TaxID=3225 RepID=A0A8T0J7W0_CERPU|nr:hypothetical protein KC19_1G137400 [Ceratodon purpureus]KAG0629815.1 hypothetical protein M758_1G132200 [Ceratodon purpureus]
MAGQVYPSAPEAPMLNINQKSSSAAGSPVLPAPATYHKPLHRGRRHRGGVAGCCCCLLSTFCSLLFAFLVLAGITILVLWLVLKPIHLPKYSLNNIDIANFAVGQNNTLNADFIYNVTAENPNRKIGIKYDYINLETSYDGQFLNSSSIPGFYQGHQNTTVLSSELKVQNYQLRQSSVTALNTQIQANNVPLHVRANAKVHVRIGKYTSPGFKVRVDCDVNMGVSPATLISKSCKLKRS